MSTFRIPTGLAPACQAPPNLTVPRRFLQEWLGHVGRESAEASGTEEALVVLQADSKFGLLIADLLMPPGPDGMFLIRQVQARHPEMPAILISRSEAPPGSVQAAANEGVTVLRKPVSPAEVTDALAALPDRAKPEPPGA